MLGTWHRLSIESSYYVWLYTSSTKVSASLLESRAYVNNFILISVWNLKKKVLHKKTLTFSFLQKGWYVAFFLMEDH